MEGQAMSEQDQTIYLITNRNVLKSRNNKETGFGKFFNEKAPDELRLATVTGNSSKWALDILLETKKKGPIPAKRFSSN